MRHVSELLNRTRYKSELDSEEWQDYSAEILRHSRHCEICKRTNISLTVHHIFYEPSKHLWEYNRDEVVVLCWNCHKEMHEHLKNFRRYVFKHLNPQAFRILNGALSVALDQYDPLTFFHALAEFVSSPTLVERYAKSWS